MKLNVLEEVRLKLLEKEIVDRVNKLESKKDKTDLDYAILLELLIEAHQIQDEIFTIKKQRELLTIDDVAKIISDYQKKDNMPDKEFFMDMK
ncbi:hypothetical protein ACWIUH_05195 [Ursidibacter arcticus]